MATIEDVLPRVGEWVRTNNPLFNGVDPRNIIAHLGVVNPALWNELNTAYAAGNRGTSAATAAGQGALKGSVLPGIGTTIGAGYGAAFGRKKAPTLNEWGFQNPDLGQGFFTLPSNPPPVAAANKTAAPAFNPGGPYTFVGGKESEQAQADSVNSLLNTILSRQMGQTGDAGRNAGEGYISTIFDTQRKAAERSVNDRYIADRTRAAEELAAFGNLGNVGARNATLGAIDTDRNRSLDSILESLTGGQASAMLDLDSNINNRELNLANFGLGIAGLSQGNKQLERAEQLSRDKILADVNEGRENRGMAARVGDAAAREARDAQYDPWGDAISILGGVGSLAAGGGKLGAGIAALNMAGNMYGNKSGGGGGMSLSGFGGGGYGGGGLGTLYPGMYNNFPTPRRQTLYGFGSGSGY